MYRRYNYLTIVLLLSFLLLTGCDFLSGSDSSEKIDNQTVEGLTENGNWTMMIYMAADNSLESYLLTDLEEMVNGYNEISGNNVVLFVDRKSGGTSEEGMFNENFTDSRMYTLVQDGVKRISGGNSFPEITENSSYEANTGDPENLKKFIQSSKEQFPAEKYALILWNHGSGPRGVSDTHTEYNSREFGSDDSSDEDALYTGEISDVLGEEESVDFLGFDACLMGSIEVAYQYRKDSGGFSADIMVASPDEEHGDGWNYEYIFKRIFANNTHLTDEKDKINESFDYEIAFNPKDMNALELGSVCVEEYQDNYTEKYTYEQTMSCYDLSKVTKAKYDFDTFSILLTEKESSVASLKIGMISYYTSNSEYETITIPLYDIYSVCKVLNLNIEDDDIKTTAENAMDSIDEMILFSWSQSFENDDYKKGANGISLFFPYGDQSYYDYYEDETYSHWELQYWYNSERVITDVSYGNLFWCGDNAVKNDNVVSNWFELLDYWYDKDNTRDTNSYEF